MASFRPPIRPSRRAAWRASAVCPILSVLPSLLVPPPPLPQKEVHEPRGCAPTSWRCINRLACTGVDRLHRAAAATAHLPLSHCASSAPLQLPPKATSCPLAAGAAQGVLVPPPPTAVAAAAAVATVPSERGVHDCSWRAGKEPSCPYTSGSDSPFLLRDRARRCRESGAHSSKRRAHPQVEGDSGTVCHCEGGVTFYGPKYTNEHLTSNRRALARAHVPSSRAMSRRVAPLASRARAPHRAAHWVEAEAIGRREVRVRRPRELGLSLRREIASTHSRRSAVFAQARMGGGQVHRGDDRHGCSAEPIARATHRHARGPTRLHYREVHAVDARDVGTVSAHDACTHGLHAPHEAQMARRALSCTLRSIRGTSGAAGSRSHPT